MTTKLKFNGLSGNVLKIIAAVSMLIDHIGLIFFPNLDVLRIIGRLAFPIFAYFIYEGSRYTRNKLRYFLQISILGVLCFVVQLCFTGVVYLNVLITFSLSLIIIFGIDYLLKEKDKLCFFLVLTNLIIFLAIIVCFHRIGSVDYGLFGILLPVFPYVCGLIFKGNKKFLILDFRFYAFAIGLLILSFRYGALQYYSLISLLLLALYNGRRGFKLTKYFFYIFYPTHLALLWGINYLIMVL